MFWRWQQISDTSVSLRVRVLGPQEPEVVLEDGRARCECSDSWQVSDVPQMVLNVHKLELEGRQQELKQVPLRSSVSRRRRKIWVGPSRGLGVIPCVKQDEVPISRMHLRKLRQLYKAWTLGGPCGSGPLLQVHHGEPAKDSNGEDEALFRPLSLKGSRVRQRRVAHELNDLKVLLEALSISSVFL